MNRKTSKENINRKRAGKTKWLFLAAGIFCLVFAVVYEIFSHGVVSIFMVGAWVFPVVLGFVPCLLFEKTPLGKHYPGCISRYCWYTAAAAFTLGSIFEGVLEIFGTTNSLSKVFWYGGAVFACVSVICFILMLAVKGVDHRFNENRHRGVRWVYQILASILLIAFSVYAVLDTFVITRVYSAAVTNGADMPVYSETTSQETADQSETEGVQIASEKEESETSESTTVSKDPVITDAGYSDGNIEITLTEYEENDTVVYVADVQIADISYLRTAFADDSYGKNVTETTSEISQSVDAVLAINGDYYGSRETGYVIRNGVLYRNTGSGGQEDLAIMSDGSFETFDEGDVSAEEILAQGALQTFSFGPVLISDGKMSVSEDDEVAKSMTSNPRTAIGMIEPGHYIFVVADGRTSESEGLSLYELAEFMEGLGCTEAYNLDGGGSSTMYFNGEVVNNPTTNGNRISERAVSDIIYIGV